MSRGTNSEKLGGVCKTENLAPDTVWEETSVEGREILVHMMENQREATPRMSQSDFYDAKMSPPQSFG